MQKIKKVLLLAISLMLIATLVGGCASKEEKTVDSTSQQQGMNMTGVMGMMNQNPSMMMDVMSSPDTRQSMTNIMSSQKMMPVMMDMMQNSGMQQSMVKIMGDQKTREAMVTVMSNPAMQQPMIEIMADPKMKDTFIAMMKDPKLMPVAKEAMGVK